MRLFEVSLRAALSQSCDYIVILNPRAIGIQARHIEVALTLLRSQKVSCSHHAFVVFVFIVIIIPSIP
ncbi:unnamed protein product [Dibothriocephalus latus]|uniref:Uncharacterized protein n=1 Tax=Dibothriocephalus latus TaxID=60516 RepID=A0A3P7LWR4_DIBLA|nr:unnamed protein product [Dibothriocephalus latus]